MKVLVVDPSSYSLPYDYFYIKSLLNFCDVDFLCSKVSTNSGFYNKIEELPINFISYSVSASISGRFFGLFQYFMMLVYIARNHKQYKYIHFQWSVFFVFEFFLFLFLGRKVLFTFHNNVPHEFSGKIYIPYWLISRLVKLICFVSGYTSSVFRSDYSYTGKYVLVPHGIMPHSENVPLSGQIKPADFIFWGRIEPYKGIDFFLNNLQDRSVKIVGRWSPALGNVKKLLQSMDNIEIVDDYVSESYLLNLLSCNSIFVLPYVSATQSGVLYSLLAHSCVFVSSDVGENGEFLFRHGFPGLIFDREDSASFSDAVEYASTNYDEIKLRMSLISSKYQWDNVMSRQVFDALYEK